MHLWQIPECGGSGECPRLVVNFGLFCFLFDCGDGTIIFVGEFDLGNEYGGTFNVEYFVGFYNGGL